MLLNCRWIEDLEIDGIVADNGDIIFSRHPTDYRVSDDGSVWINGSGEHTERPVVNIDRLVKISVFKGRVEVWFDSD